MQAKIISVLNQKGGPGKTTITMQLSAALGIRGRKVLVVDADKQGTATRWARSADDNAPFPASIAGLAAADTKVHREVAKFVNDFEFIFIDCPPAVESQIPQSALLVADLALVPLIPSPPDVWAGVAIRRLIENAVAVNEHLQARLVINQLEPGTTLGREVLDILPQFDIEICRTHLGHRQAYRQSAGFGASVHYLRSRAKDAIAEVEALTDEVLGLLQSGVDTHEAKSEKRTRRVAAG